MSSKKSFSVNANNLLVIKRTKKEKPLVANGNFSADKENRLLYLLNEPAGWKKQYSIPPKIIFNGRWRLSPNYDLEFILDKTPQQFQGERLHLKGKFILADKDALLFEIKSIDKRQQQHIRLLKLSGSWKADERNNLKFSVEKKPSPDTLTLASAWEINKNQQITYTFEKIDLKTKTKTSHILTFEGFWQINESNRLTYILSGGSESRFDFRAQLESPNLYPAQGRIKYRIGVGLRQKKTQERIICLYGAWKFSRRLGLVFEMDYGKSKLRKIEFGAQLQVTKSDCVIFSLTNRKKEPLGMSLTSTHKFLKTQDAQAFLKLKKYPREAGIEAGLRIPF